MDRLACLDVPALPLRLLLDDHPQWEGKPVAVVAEDHPRGVLLWANRAASARGVRPGQRLAAALAFEPRLLSGVVSPERLARGLADLTERLRRFSPRVEPSRESPGVFWLDADGLERLFGSLDAWATALGDSLLESRQAGALVVGFGRFATYAVARALSHRGGVVVFSDRDAERAAVRRVPLDRLLLDPVFVVDLEKLGVATLGDYLDLPSAGLRERFGEEAWHLHRAASGDTFAPFTPEILLGPVRARLEYETPEPDLGRLLAAIAERLPALLAELGQRDEALTALDLVLFPAVGEPRSERIEPAVATLDPTSILELLHLRLESRRLPGPVQEVHLTARSERVSSRQGFLFAASGRDGEAAARALARVRAAFGPGCVTRARLAEGHLPESSFAFEEISALTPARVRIEGSGGLVRRLRTPPRPLDAPGGDLRNDGWLLDRWERGPTRRLVGPFVLSGGWWVKTVRRDYHYAETERGDLLWIYRDRQRRRWFLHGEVR